MTQFNFDMEQAFIARIERLDTGALASLRRACGERDPIEGRCPWFYGLVQGVASVTEAFLVASLLAQFKTSDIKSGRHRLTGNFGVTCKRAHAMGASDSFARRFTVLLDAEFAGTDGSGDLPYRLRQMVRYAASKGIGIDWPQLLVDLHYWNDPAKRTQKQWARSYFTTDSNENTSSNTTNSENTPC